MKILATTTRGNVEDLYTYGSFAIVDSTGKLIYENGDSSKLAYARSSAKLMQAVSTLSLGAAEKFGFTGAEVATMCASHSGEDFHIKTVNHMLEKIGLDKSYLKCGAHMPYNPEAKAYMQANNIPAEAIHNNCSGKHTGMLTAATILGADLETYYKMENPVQIRILETIATICAIDKDKIEIGIDGCGVPVHAMPIRTFAYGMARLANPATLPDDMADAARLISKSIIENPVYTSGTERIDYQVIKRARGKVIVKSGANGYFGGYFPEKKWGFALKTYDGNGANKDIILVEILKKLEIMAPKDIEDLEEFVNNPIKNHRGEVVGRVIPNVEI